MLFAIFKYLFSFQRYSSFYNMQISQVMTSYTLNLILFKYDEKRYLSQISSHKYQEGDIARMDSPKYGETLKFVCTKYQPILV